ncbi:TIGR03557 family F420-dependent LLM class oxidoreductase [Nocardioides alkalitolerans]|uniref:TIGR03557 family F420-dependent LLM class oxidoreductase n=1 Tax=Nocardioides alkalitolerans TaxID=281714 RepID=UPI0005B8A025|nr:TIGR03557 family F420-dependent LLM class oxidoreductase [Nocardioides alkalitolerans]
MTLSGARVGFAAMLEQLAPSRAVALAERAEGAGFRGTMASDHFQPWLPRQANASFVWNVLSAVGVRTTGDLGPGALTPTFRWHPAMVAQASATLAAMYPGRHWLGLGSGDAISEHVTGEYWPEPHERISRLFEAIELIKKLFAASAAGRDVRHRGQYFKMESTRLWTMPAKPPPILVATSGPVTAHRAGKTVDGLITMNAPIERLALLLDRFNAGVRESGRRLEDADRILQLHLSWAATDEEAVANAVREWPNGAIGPVKSDVRSPFEFAQMGRLVGPDSFEGRVSISADPEVHRRVIQRCLDVGFDRVYLHNVGPNQEEWIDVFGRDVLPGLTG